MGSFCHLINKELRISTEAYKYSGGGDMQLYLTEEKKLVLFMEYCRVKKLKIECVHDAFFESERDKEIYYRELTPDEIAEVIGTE
jgi:hypothetical protein